MLKRAADGRHESAINKQTTGTGIYLELSLPYFPHPPQTLHSLFL